MLKGGGGTKGFEVVLTRELEDLAILEKRGTQKVLPYLEGAGEAGGGALESG